MKLKTGFRETILFFILGYFNNVCVCQELNTSIKGYKLGDIKIGKYKKRDCTQKLDKRSKNYVYFQFFNFFEDTITMYVDDKFIFKRGVSRDTNIVSTDYTGLCFGVKFPSKKNKLTLISQNEDEYIIARLKRKYFLYSVAKWNGVWVINPTNCSVVGK